MRSRRGKHKLKNNSAFYYLSNLGNVVPLNLFVHFEDIKKTISAYKEHFKPYTPKKEGCNRYGLSLTSRDGSLADGTGLQSLYEYNKQHGTHLDEPDFRKWTPVFNDSLSLKSAMKPFHNCMGRSHILKLNKGGFFPPHRDLLPRSFRLFVSLTSNSHYIFTLDQKNISFEQNQVYFVNTVLVHSLFSFKNESLFIVFNIDYSEEAVRGVFNNLGVR